MAWLRTAAITHRDVIIAGLLLLASISFPLLWSERELSSATDSFQVESSGERIGRPLFDALIVRLDKQKEQRSEWAYTALVGIIVISVVKKVFPIPWVRWTYILLGAAGTLLLQSIRAGDLYERRIAYLISSGDIRSSDVDGISLLLWKQLTFLNVALGVLLVFVTAFLLAVASGKTTFSLEEE